MRCVLFAVGITMTNLFGPLKVTSRANFGHDGHMSLSVVWFVAAAAKALSYGIGAGTLALAKALLQSASVFLSGRDDGDLHRRIQFPRF